VKQRSLKALSGMSLSSKKRSFLTAWMLALRFLRDVRTANPDEIARHFRLTYESVIFILGKLTRDGKIKMQASGEKN
jgi:hypothetical protein